MLSHEIADDTSESLKIRVGIHSHHENSEEPASSPAGSSALGSFLFGPWVLMNIFTLELSLLPPPSGIRNEGSECQALGLSPGNSMFGLCGCG